jgi:hypothetical protein
VATGRQGRAEEHIKTSYLLLPRHIAVEANIMIIAGLQETMYPYKILLSFY